MAETFGSRARAFFVAILIGLLVVAFAVWGINDVFSQRTTDSVLKVGDVKVSNAEFNQAYRQSMRVLAEEQGLTLTNQQAYDRGVHRQVLNTLLANKIDEVDANDLGIGVNTRTARKVLAEYDVFKDDLTGKFSVNTLDSVLARQSPAVTREQFEKELTTMLRQQQTRPVIAGGVKAPMQFADQKYKFLTEQRDVKVLTISDQSVPAAPEPTDAQIQTYIDANPIRFTAPEYRRITLLRMEPQDFVLMDSRSMAGVQSEENLKKAFNNIFISDEQVKADYDYKVGLGDLGSPATRSLVQITANSEENANAIAAKLKEGLTPIEVTTLFGLIEPITYDGVVAESILDPETAKAAFEMENGEIRSFVGGFGNWVTVQITDAVAEVKPDITTVRDEIVRNLITVEATDRIYDKMAAIQDMIDEGRNLEEAAEAVGLPYATIDYVDRSGTTMSGVRLTGNSIYPGIAQDEEILTMIFTADQNFETDYFDTSTGGQAIIRVDGIIESKPKLYEDIKDEAARYWKTEYIEKAVNDLMLELVARANAGESLADIHASIENGATLEDYSINRAQPNSAIGQALNYELLEASKGDLKRGNGPARLTRQIAKLENIISNEEEMGSEIATLIQDQVTAEIIQDLNIAYRQAVLQEHPFVENTARVKQLMGVATDTE